MANWFRSMVNWIFLGAYNKNPEYYDALPGNIILKASDGHNFGACLLNSELKKNDDTRYMVYIHGTGSDRADAIDYFKYKLAYRNAVFLFVDVRGFGGATDKFSKDGANRDIEAAFNYMKSSYKTDKIEIIGHSFGCALSLAYTDYASKDPNRIVPYKIYLFAPFKRLTPILKTFRTFKILFKISPLIANYLIKDLEYDNLTMVKKFQEKITIFHSIEDRSIPLSHSEELASKAPKVKFYQCISDHLNIVGLYRCWDLIFESSLFDDSQPKEEENDVNPNFNN